jgi:hypothetical protein
MMEPLEWCRRRAHRKSPFLSCQLSVFFALARYRVVKIACSCSEVVLRTMKNYKAHLVYPSSGPCYEVIAPRAVFFVLKKKNSVTIG